MAGRRTIKGFNRAVLGRISAPMLLAGLMAMLLVPLAHAAQDVARDGCEPPEGRIAYRVLNDETPVGRAEMVVIRDGDTAEIHTAIDFKIKLLSVTLYSYRHRSIETWKNGRFLSLRGMTEDSRKRYDVSIKADGDRLHVVHNGQVENVPGTLLTELVWCPAAARTGDITSTLTGGTRHILFEPVAHAIRASTRAAGGLHVRFSRKGRVGELLYGADGIVERASQETRYGTTAVFERIHGQGVK